MKLRLATQADVDLLREWRDDVSTRAASGSRRRLARAEHIEWLTRRIDARNFWVGCDSNSGGPVGVFGGQQMPDSRTRFFEVSVTVAPAFRRMGFGKALVRAGTRRLARDFLAEVCLARVRTENVASLRAFVRSGYLPHQVSRDRRWIWLEWKA